jgi:Rrf2 family protein
MCYIANLGEGVAVRTQDLSIATGVPGPYLAKLLRKMVVAGLLTSQKGHGGGFSLAKPPNFIRFLDVMVAADYVINPRHCAFGWGTCHPGSPCPLHPAWAKLNDQTAEWAARLTLADVLVNGGLPLPEAVAAGLANPAAANANRAPTEPPRARRGRRPKEKEGEPRPAA